MANLKRNNGRGNAHQEQSIDQISTPYSAAVIEGKENSNIEWIAYNYYSNKFLFYKQIDFEINFTRP